MAWCSSVASSTSDRRDEPATTAEQHNSAALGGFLGVCCRIPAVSGHAWIISGRGFGPASCPRSVSQLRWERPAEKRGKPIDGRSGLLDGLRLAESSRSGLGGELDLNERQGLLGKVIGQPGRDSGGLGEVPSVSEQIVQADLRALGAGGAPHGSGITPLEYPGTGESGLQRSAGRPEGSDRVVTEPVCPALGHRAPLDQGCEHQIHADQVVDHIAHVPFRARRRRLPLLGADLGDQVTDRFARAGEIFNRNRGGSHPARLPRPRQHGHDVELMQLDGPAGTTTGTPTDPNVAWRRVRSLGSGLSGVAEELPAGQSEQPPLVLIG
jgi:hypothetical protein